MMDVSRPEDDEHPSAGEDDGSGVVGPVGGLRYLVGFVASLVVYGLAPPVITGGAIWFAHSRLGVEASATLLAVGAGVGVGVYTLALVADVGLGALTGPSSDEDAPVPHEQRI